MADNLFGDMLGLTGDQSSGIASGLSATGGAIGSLFSSSGDAAAAGDYEKAIQITKLQTAVKENALNRQIYQTIGAGEAAGAGSGFRMSGSLADVTRSSAQQGGLAKGLVALQGQVQEQAYQAQADAANAASQSGMIGGVLGIAGALLGI